MGDWPFRDLDAFTEADGDAGYFAGRELETELVTANLLSSRLTLLYGRSGVGKTSLLRAGVLRRLHADEPDPDVRRTVPVLCDDWAGDPVRTICAAARVELGSPRALQLASAGGNGHQEVTHEDSAAATLATLCEAEHAELLLILDQFESYLARPVDERADGELAALLGDPRVPMRVLVGLREDQLAALDRFSGRVPKLFGVRYRLEGLTGGAARSAIEEPLERHRARTGSDLRAETGFVDDVIEQLLGAAERIEPVHLQLVVTRVAEVERATGSTTLRAATLAGLGGAEAIIERRFEETMASLRPSSRELAARVVGHLVTPSGLAQRQTAGDLAYYTGIPEARVAALLEELAGGRFRVLRAVAAAPVAYEIFHDTLRLPALEWARAWQTQRLKRRAARLTAALVALTALSLGLLTYVWNPTAVRRLELSALDTRFAARGAQAPEPSIALVGIDARTAAGLTRDDHAAMIDRLVEGGARAIAYDIVFDLPSQSRGADDALAQAIAEAGPRLVLATGGAEVLPEATGGTNCGEPLGDGVRGVQAAPILNRPGLIERYGVNGAFAGFPNDPGGVLRRVAYRYPLGSALEYPTFAWCAARLMRPGLAAGELPDGSRRALGTQTTRYAWIDFAGGPGRYRPVPFRDVLAGAEPVRGKAVVVGYTQDPGDRHRTSVSERPMAGVEVQANAIATLLGTAPVRDAAIVVDLLILLAAAALPVVIWRAPRWWRLAGLVALALALPVVFQLAFNRGVVLSVVPAIVAFIASVLALLGLCVVRRRRADGFS